MAQYAYDIYPSDNPVAGARLVRLTNGQGVQISYTHLGHGMGSGFISIHTDHADATEVNLHKRAWCRFVRIDTDPEQEIGGIFLDDGDFKALSRQERGGRILTFRGVGGLSILDRYVLGHAVYATGQPCRGDCTTTFEGSPSSTPDMWDWRQEPYGAMLLRSIEEGQENPAAPFAPVTVDWTRTVDSNGNAWEELSDYSTPIGTSVFALYADFLRMGLVVQCTPDLLIQAYRDVDEFRTDRTSATFAAGKARFAAGVNILDDLPKRIHPKMERTHVLTRRQNGDYQTYSTGGSGEPYFDFLRIDTTSDATAVAKIATNYLTKRAQYVDQATVRHIIGDGVGQYAPGPAGDYWVLDLATIHTGTDEHDFNNQAIEVAAITYEHDEAGNWFAVVQLGAQYIDPRLAALEQALVTTIKQLPANPQLCRPTIPGAEAELVVAWNFNHAGPGGVNVRYDDTDTYPVRGRWGGTTAATNALNLIVGQNLLSLESPRPPATAGVFYTFSVRLFVGTPGAATTDAEAHFYNAAGTLLDTAYLIGTTPNDAAWYEHILTVEAPADTATVGFAIGPSLHLNVDYVTIQAGGSTTATIASGHPDLVGTSTFAKRCDSKDHVTRDVAPTVNDDEARGYPTGTKWFVVVDGVWVATYLSLDDSDGAANWQQQPLVPHTHEGSEAVMTLEEEDGTPTGTFSILKVPNGRLTDNLDGSASLDLAASVHAHDPATPGFHGVLVQRTTDFTTTFSNDSIPDFDTEIYDTDGLWEGVTNPDRITIPADWDGLMAVIHARAGWAGHSGTYVEMKLYKNGTADETHLIAVTQHATNTASPFQELTSQPIQVAEGDYFTITFKTPNSQTLIEYEGASILFGAYLVGSGGAGGEVTEEDVMNAGRWEVVVSGTAPPVAMTNEAEDDWLYSWVSGP